MQIKLMQQLQRTFAEVEALSALLLQLSDEIRRLQERIEKLEQNNGNRQRRTAGSN